LFATLLHHLRRRPRTTGRAIRKRPPSFKPRLESLEDRLTPSTLSAASVSDLIADINAANLNNGATTIVLAPNTTFALTTVDNTIHGATGLPVIAARDSLTLSAMATPSSGAPPSGRRPSVSSTWPSAAR